MKIKLIAIDMDGTILNSNGTISQKNQDVLNKAMDMGVYIVPTTGRVLNTLPIELQQMEKIQYIITSNGAAIYKKGIQTPLYTNFMPVKKVTKVLKSLEGFDCIKEAYIDGKAYFEKSYLDRLSEFNIPKTFENIYINIKNTVDNLIDHIEGCEFGVEKINMPWLKEGIKEEITEFLNKTYDDIYITTSLANNVEINNITTNKGDGLRALCEILNLKKEDVMAIGDNFNDLEMLEFAGNKVVMENAKEEIKKIATFITLNNDNDGVAYAIEKLCLHSK